jgi:DNA polymerase III subunit delta
MKVWDLPKLLAAGNIPPAMMLYGASPYMIDYYVNKLSMFFAPDDEACKLYHNEYNFTTAKAHLSQGSLFGGNNLLVIKNEKKVPKKELDDLVAMVAKSPGNFLIYAYYGPDYTTSNKSFTSKKLPCDNVRFFEPNIKDAMPLLQEEAHKLNLAIRNDVLSHLFNTQNGDVALSINELSKLAILNRPIENKDIDALVYSLADVKLDDIIAQLLEKKDFKQDLTQLIESGEEPARIISNIASYVTMLLKYLSHMKIYGNSDAKSILGFPLPPQIHTQRINLSKKFTLLKYQEMLGLLLQAEIELKSAIKHDKEALLFSTLLKLQRLVLT